MHVIYTLLRDAEISMACVIWQDYLSCVYDMRDGKTRNKT
jgi:hypothetical protein